MLLDIGLGNDFVFRHDIKSISNRSKNKKVKLQIKNLLHSKINFQQNEKAIYRMWENIYKSYFDKELISKMLEAHTVY